jgi:hypothetical protein
LLEMLSAGKVGQERWAGLEQLGLRGAGITLPNPALIEMQALKFRITWGAKGQDCRRLDFRAALPLRRPVPPVARRFMSRR